MIAKDRGREARWLSYLLLFVVIALAYPVRAQQDAGARYQLPPPAPGGDAPAPKATASPKVRLSEIDVPQVKPAAIPVNPGDAIAVVNRQNISRQQLADECVAREGKKILELLVNRTLIEQALTLRNLQVTGAEIDQEIQNVAARFGIDRQKWLLTLEKERGISPMQYARDIVYPALALRKLCAGRVQVTPKDMQDAFEAQYGEKIRCRMIMVDKQTTGMEVWEELKKNPGAFEKLAQERSVDTGSRSLGGLLAQPITRHAFPQELSDKAFRELVRRRSEGSGPQPQTEGRRLHRADSGQRIGLGHLAARGVDSWRQEHRSQGRTGSQAVVRDDLRGQAQGGDGLRLPGIDEGGRDREQANRFDQAGQ